MIQHERRGQQRKEDARIARKQRREHSHEQSSQRQHAQDEGLDVREGRHCE
jgi:hypothetical protein